jgi:hypothetical protein
MRAFSLRDRARGSYRRPRGVEQPENGFIRSPEEWRRIPQFRAYEISSYLRVLSRSSGKVLRPWYVRGYPFVSLRAYGATHKFLVARLYGIAFLGLAPDQEIDHRTMRVATRGEIVHRNPGRAFHTSRFKGVSRAGRRWFACIKIHGVTRSLGSFDDEISAARAYDAAARRAWGPAAFQNFPEAAE